MVQWQLCTLEHLMNSGFGRPFPRHGLQLLFWFANHCVTCDLINSVVIMRLVSDCEPEKGFYGFHLFGNIEELLPVLDRPRKRKSKRQVAYYEVGNLNTETYPSSANLPTYVRENYGLDGNHGSYNTDRIIISYHMRTRLVETVYVTEHDGEGFGRFSPDRTYEISFELIESLQSPQLDLTSFLNQMDYYGGIVVAQANNTEEIHYPALSAQQAFNIVQAYSGYPARTVQIDGSQFFSDTFNHQLGVNIEPFNYRQQQHYIVNVTSHKSRKSHSRQNYLPSGWVRIYQGIDEEAKKRKGGGGITFTKILLSAGALYLAAKCFSWLRSSWKGDLNEQVLKIIPWRPPSYQHPHIMLDYVY